MGNVFKDILGFLAGEGLSTLKKTVDKTIKDVEERVERATIKVIKTSILFLMMVVGFLFILIGLAKYLNETVPGLAHGIGTMLVGGILIVLALFVRVMK